MYLEHFGLKEPPFSITPDPRFVFLSERHRDALAHLLFGIDKGGGGGFVQLTGEVGTGKTTLCRLLLEQLSDTTRVALVLNPRLSPVELLETICEELHIPLDGTESGTRRGSLKALVDALNAYLLDAYARGLRVALIIDEAQNLSVDALEQVRLLTNLETSTQKLLQILLLGQPELRTILARDDLRQLAQRITARYHLTPLSGDETAAYLRHRFRVAGGLHLPFTARAVQRIHAHSGGVPRLINVIAERALLGAYAQDLTAIDHRFVDRAAREALPEATRRGFGRREGAIAVALGVALLAAAGAWALRPASSPPAVTPQSSRVAVASTAKPRAMRVARLDAQALAARVATSTAPWGGWQHLLGLWNLPASVADAGRATACPPVIARGVYCVRGRGSLDKLTAQERPAMLLLRDGDAQRWVALLGADARHARLWLDDATVDVPRIALERAWGGDYAIVWRAPDDVVAPITAASPPAALAWVRDGLAPQYLAKDAPATLDAAMREAVLRFQRDRGLAADGVVGPETLMALAAHDPGPRLRAALE